MPPVLEQLRQTPQILSEKFVAANPGCWIQYYDDTEAKDPAKALSVPTFDSAVARRKQQQLCAVCFSLQAFGASRTKEGLLCFHNLGVDVDLVAATERRALTTEEIDLRKDEYLADCLLPFPLKPHWLIETGHGFHVIFRIQPVEVQWVPEALALNRQLVSLLRGDLNAVLLTQVLRVPGTEQFKDPEHPFFCRLLLDNASSIVPYDLEVVRSVLHAWAKHHGTGAGAEAGRTSHNTGRKLMAQRRADLAGVPEGSRNSIAASIVGGILGRLPNYLWEIAGWGGLKEWNQRNRVPLPARELRSVYVSIARRERYKRQRKQKAAAESAKPDEPGNGTPVPIPSDPQ